MERVEVKVCERCGGLWLRPAAQNGERGLIYCSPCARVMAQMPAARKELPNGRRKKRDNRSASNHHGRVEAMGFSPSNEAQDIRALAPATEVLQ